jgi:hypothetical protein
LVSFCAVAQENSPFSTGFEETISSKILGKDRKVWIHIPSSNGGNKIKDRGNYPVIYLLDGNEKPLPAYDCCWHCAFEQINGINNWYG